MGVAETKLSDEIEVFNIGEVNYKVWKRNRKNKQGGGVMFMIKKRVMDCIQVTCEDSERISNVSLEPLQVECVALSICINNSEHNIPPLIGDINGQCVASMSNKGGRGNAGSDSFPDVCYDPVLLLYYKHLLFLDSLVCPAASLLERLSTLRPQNGRGTAQGSHLEILSVTVVADEPADGVECTAGPGLDGGLDHILGWLVLVFGSLVGEDDPLATRCRFNANHLPPANTIVSWAVDILQVVGLSGERL